MKFGLNDVFDSLETALDIKKVSFHFLGLLIALTGLALLLWIGNIANNPFIGALLVILAVVFLYYITATVAVGISRMAYKELTSGEKISINDALSFSKENIISLLFSPVFLALAAAAVLGIEYIVFLLAKIAAGKILISLLTIPLILLNVFVLLVLGIGCSLIFGIISVDESGILATLNKIFTAAKKAPLQILMCLALVLVFGTPVIASGLAIFFAAITLTLSLFGSASGLFTELIAVEVPSLSASMQAAALIFSISALLLLGFMCSYICVYLNTAAVSIYLKIKGQLK